MDSVQCKKRIFITYFFTLSMLSFFFYHLLWSSRKTILEVSRLQEDVSFLKEKVQQGKGPYAENIANTNPGGHITGDSSRSNDPSVGRACDSRELNAQVDSLFKTKIGTLMDDVYSLKKSIMKSGCSNPDKSLETDIETIIARINYASEELGASITNVLAKPIGDSNFIKTLLGLEFITNPPVNMLKSSILPGSCFGFGGPNATISLRLAKAIIVEELRLTHVPKELTPSLSVDNAPKDFEVYGLASDCNKKELLGQWAYSNEPSMRTQSFLVINEGIFTNLIIAFKTNHGGNSTCIYRFEVYGRLP